MHLAIDVRKPHHWQDISSEETRNRPALSEEVATDLVVIGGGVTGLAAALAASEAGSRVVLLELDRIGAAASGRSNGQIIPHHSRHSPSEIEALLGSARGTRYNAMVARAAAEVFGLIDRRAIKCDAVQNGWIQAAHAPSKVERLRRYQDEWCAFGARAEWLDADGMRERTGSHIYVAGWQAHDGGHVNPYAYCQGLGRAVESAGGLIFTDSPVTSICREGAGWRVGTPEGAVVADQVLIANNAIASTFWPRLSKTAVPVKVYQVATSPIGANLRGLVLPGNQAMSDTRLDIRAFRYDARGGLVSVGVHSLWHNATVRGRRNGRRIIAATFPELSQVGIAAYWEGILGVVPERLPRLMRLAAGLVFAGVYSGRGMALGTAFGGVVGRWMAGALSESELPLPVTEGLVTIPLHGLAVQVGRFVHPFHRLRDRMA